MKKFFLISLGALALLVVFCLFAWANKTNFTASYFARELGVPVRMQTLHIHTGGADVSRFWVGNPPRAKTSTAFSSDTIQIATTFSQLVGETLVIDDIALADIYVGIEYYSSNKKKSNWDEIFSNRPEKSDQNGRDYLIKTLTLDRMKIEVVDAKGGVKTYTLPHMEFHNISRETGFPIGEIEKAIFNQIIQQLIQKFTLDQLMNPGTISIPKTIPLPFFQ